MQTPRKEVTSGLGTWLSWQGAGLACPTSRAPSSVLHKVGMVIQPSNSTMWELEAGKEGVHGHSQLHGESEASLGYMTLFQKQKVPTSKLWNDKT